MWFSGMIWNKAQGQLKPLIQTQTGLLHRNMSMSCLTLTDTGRMIRGRKANRNNFKGAIYNAEINQKYALEPYKWELIYVSFWYVALLDFFYILYRPLLYYRCNIKEPRLFLHINKTKQYNVWIPYQMFNVFICLLHNIKIWS